MEGTCTKTGSLMKSGPHKYQPWRKRWFVLTLDHLKYYNGKETSDTNHLGTIQMVDIQSVKESKEKKHSFEINTRSRTYYMQAKTDMIRDDWVVAIRTNTTSQRLVIQDTANDSNIYAEIGPGSCGMGATTSGTSGAGVYVQVQHGSTSSVSSSDTDVSVEYGKILRAQSVSPPHSSDAAAESKKLCARSMSEGMAPSKGRGGSVVGLLHDMSMEEEDMATFYQNIEAKLDATIDEEDEDEDEGDDDVEEEKGDYHLPQPRDGNETFAFDEMKLLLEKLAVVGYDVDGCSAGEKGEGEYPAMQLLGSYLENSSLMLGL